MHAFVEEDTDARRGQARQAVDAVGGHAGRLVLTQQRIPGSILAHHADQQGQRASPAVLSHVPCLRMPSIMLLCEQCWMGTEQTIEAQSTLLTGLQDATDSPSKTTGAVYPF